MSENSRAVTIDDAIARLHGPQLIELSELAIIPLTTLYDYARAVSSDIDEGKGIDSRRLLEAIFDEIKGRVRRS